MTTGPETPPPDPTQPYGSVPPPPPPPPSPGYAGYTQPGLPTGAYGVSSQAPYGLHPVTGIPYSDKSKIVAGLLQILLPFGIGRFYIGDTKTGVLQLIVAVLTCGIGGLWSLIDGILMLVHDDTKDARGYILRS
jgi:TM2 domain-containing membrane protein YozV